MCILVLHEIYVYDGWSYSPQKKVFSFSPQISGIFEMKNMICIVWKGKIPAEFSSLSRLSQR